MPEEILEMWSTTPPLNLKSFYSSFLFDHCTGKCVERTREHGPIVGLSFLSGKTCLLR